MPRSNTCAGCVAALLLASVTAWAQAPEPPPAMAPVVAHPLRPGIQLLSGAACNIAVWSGVDGLVVVDAGAAPTAAAVLEAVNGIAAGPTRFLINTQWHPDHAGGNEALARAGTLVVAHDAARARMNAPGVGRGERASAASSPAALPMLTFDDTITLHLNGDRLTALHVDAAQSDGDVILWWEEANIVQLGDVYDRGAYPRLDLDSGGSLAGLVAAIETVLSRADDATLVVPGHGAVSNRAELASYRDMLVAVGRSVGDLVAQGRSLDEVLAARPTEAFDAQYGRGAVNPERFVSVLYEDLAGRR
jgi:glyoxylase-like metal-dependent hydrolase (beta-lactamase superfamily II)